MLNKKTQAVVEKKKKQPSFSSEGKVSRLRVVPNFTARHIHTKRLRSKKSVPHLCTTILPPSVCLVPPHASSSWICNTQNQQGHKYLHPASLLCTTGLRLDSLFAAVTNYMLVRPGYKTLQSSCCSQILSPHRVH